MLTFFFFKKDNIYIPYLFYHFIKLKSKTLRQSLHFLSSAVMKAFVAILFCSLLMMIITENIKDKPSLNTVIICPDAVSVCPLNSTCCKSTAGDYSCCPLEYGICCSDGKHCCPRYYMCDLEIFKCNRTINPKMLELKPQLDKN